MVAKSFTTEYMHFHHDAMNVLYIQMFQLIISEVPFNNKRALVFNSGEILFLSHKGVRLFLLHKQISIHFSFYCCPSGAEFKPRFRVRG